MRLFTSVLLSLNLCCLTHATVTSSTATEEEELRRWPIMARGAFTPAECDSIIDLYTSRLERVQDTREAESVSRINRFDVRKQLQNRGDLDWIIDRVVTRLPVDDGVTGTLIRSGDVLKKAIDFTLLHEFNPGMHFGLHVDTRPNDGTYRTFNINVMCSDASSYSGGELQVGDSVVQGLAKGDLYMYPASLPHAVHELDSGLRYTYIIALQVPIDADNDGLRQLYLDSYWKDAEIRLTSLASPPGRMGEVESKLHLIHAQFLESSGDRTDAEIDEQYCKAYKATPESTLYAQKFFEDGMAMRQGGNDKMAENYFTMAVCIDPSHSQAQQALSKTKRLFGVATGRRQESDL